MVTFGAQPHLNFGEALIESATTANPACRSRLGRDRNGARQNMRRSKLQEGSVNRLQRCDPVSQRVVARRAALALLQQVCIEPACTPAHPRQNLSAQRKSTPLVFQ